MQQFLYSFSQIEEIPDKRDLNTNNPKVTIQQNQNIFSLKCNDQIAFHQQESKEQQLESNNFTIKQQDQGISQSDQSFTNPEESSKPSKFNMKYLYEMSRSVKEMMKSNKDYRGELLSVYQSRSKTNLENAILLKEKQILEDENNALLQQLQKYRKKVDLLQNCIKKLKQNHKHKLEKSSKEIEDLQVQISRYANAKQSLGYKSAQNKFLLQEIRNDQTQLSQRKDEIEKLSNENMQLKIENELLKQKYNSFEIAVLKAEMNNLSSGWTRIDDYAEKLNQKEKELLEMNHRYVALAQNYNSLCNQYSLLKQQISDFRLQTIQEYDKQIHSLRRSNERYISVLDAQIKTQDFLEIKIEEEIVPNQAVIVQENQIGINIGIHQTKNPKTVSQTLEQNFTNQNLSIEEIDRHQRNQLEGKCIIELQLFSHNDKIDQKRNSEVKGVNIHQQQQDALNLDTQSGEEITRAQQRLKTNAHLLSLELDIDIDKDRI